MATNEWRGDAVAVAQEDTITVTGPASSVGTAWAEQNGKRITVPVADLATAEAIAGDLYDAISASDIAEFREQTWSYPGSGAVITAVMNTPGQPFTLTAGKTGTGTTVTAAVVTAATGPNNGAEPKNWTLGTIPGATDDVVIRFGPAILWNLDTTFSAAAASVRHYATHTAGVGLPVMNTGGGGDGYREYRPRFLDTKATPEVWVGEGEGAGPDIFNVRVSGARSVYVRRAAGVRADGTPAVELQTYTALGAKLFAFGGSVGYGVTAEATLQLAELHAAGEETQVVSAGPVEDLFVRGGEVLTRGATDDTVLSGGVWTHEAGDLVSIKATSGIARLAHKQDNPIHCEFQGGGVDDPPVLDLSADPLAARDIDATSYFRGGAYILDPDFTAVLTTVEFDRASFAASDVGDRFKVTRAAV